MATFINTIDSVEERSDINFIPCSVGYNGKAKTSVYFNEKEDSDGKLVSSFRGRPLMGSKISLPEGYSGYVLQKPEKNSQPCTYDVKQSFKKFKYWNLDREPSKNDAILSALDWLEFSNVIHQKEDSKELQINNEVDEKI